MAKKYKQVKLPPEFVQKMKMAAVSQNKTIVQWARDALEEDKDIDVYFKKKKTIRM